MKKLVLLAALALSLFLLGHGILWPGNSAAMPMPQGTPAATETPSPTPQGTPVATETPSPTPQATPVATETPLPIPTLALDKEVAEALVVDLDGDGKVDPGDTIRYTVSYSNTGQITATNVILVDDYGETLIESVANITGEGKDDGDIIIWEMEALAGGKGGSVSYEATLKGMFPPGTTTLGNEATISSNEVEPIRAAKAVLVQSPELAIAKAREEVDVDEDGVIDGGDIIKYKITYENKGGADATNVVIIDDYSETFIAGIDNISGDGEDDGSAITWELGTVKAGVKASLTYEVKLKSKFPPGTPSVGNTADIKSDGTYPVSVEQSVPIKVPNLTIAKEKAPGLINDLNDNGIADPGDTVKYDITYKNKGDADATGVTIVDDYPETLIVSIGNISGDGENGGSTITWNLGTLAAGKSGSLSYEATLGETFPPGLTNVKNQVTISSEETEPTSATATVRVEVVPTPAPELTPVPPAEGPTAGIFATQQKLLIALIFLLGLGGIIGLIFAGLRIPISDEDGNERLLVILEGITVNLIICAVIVLALGLGIKSEAAASIISAVAGYMFGRARARVSK